MELCTIISIIRIVSRHGIIKKSDRNKTKIEKNTRRTENNDQEDNMSGSQALEKQVASYENRQHHLQKFSNIQTIELSYKVKKNQFRTLWKKWEINGPTKNISINGKKWKIEHENLRSMIEKLKN